MEVKLVLLENKIENEKNHLKFSIIGGILAVGFKINEIRNEEIFSRIEERPYIWNYMKRRRYKLIKHNIRYPGILVLLLEEKVEKKNWISGQKFQYVKQICEL